MGLGTVRVSAVIENLPPEKVYNLTVAETPEYFANGILVHNCDSLRYVLVAAAQSIPNWKPYQHPEKGRRKI